MLLAGGDGIRLRDLTVRIVGDCRPKQFCPIVGPKSLLSQTRSRLDPLFSVDRQVFVVCRAHENYYSEELAGAKDPLVIAQPMNRGTAVGIIAALVRIMQSEPDAIVAFFPCDHHYADDEAFRSTVRSAISAAHHFPESLVIVGAEADYAETEYGWIEPGVGVFARPGKPQLYRVNRFWEKPALPQARRLLQDGCLWNTFVMVGSAPTFLEVVCSGMPDVVLSIMRATTGEELSATYARLPNVDFSRDILAHEARRLLVLQDSGSGWADLGSPARVLALIAKNADQPDWFHRAHSLLPDARKLRGVV